MSASDSETLVLAIDQGTHASRALVFDHSGRAVAEGVQEIGLVRPHPDWAEQDGDEIVASVQGAVAQVAAQLGPRAGAVQAAGLASQRSNAVCWDRVSGAPLSPVFSWQDRRAHAQIVQMGEFGEEVHRRSGLFLSPHYGATKLRWSLDHLPAVGAALADGRLAWGPMTSFVTFHILRESPLLADPQCAARTQLWNLEQGDWDEWLLSLFELPFDGLPRCVPTVFPYGTLPMGEQDVPLGAVNGDQSAALFALGWPEGDTAYVNAGTGAFAQRVVDRYVGYVPRLLTGVVLEDESQRLYALEGTVNGCASALDWAERELELPGLVKALPAWLSRETDETPLFLNGVSGLGAPFWQADFESRFEGSGEPWQRAVAVVESIAFLLQANLEELARHLPSPARVRISGGVSRLDGLCQALSDVSGLPVLRRDDPEGTARGIAYLAAGCPGHWARGAEEEAFRPRPESPVIRRYRAWRERMRDLTGI